MSVFSRAFVIILLSILSLSTLFAQDYSTAFGIRTGSSSGVNVKHFFGNTTAFEGMMVYHRTSIRAVGLLEQHFFLGRRSSSSIYLGVGGHGGYAGIFDPELTNGPVYGIDFILGFEYVFPHSPMVLSLDMKPLLEFRRGSLFSGNNGGVSLRFIVD